MSINWDNNYSDINLFYTMQQNYRLLIWFIIIDTIIQFAEQFFMQSTFNRISLMTIHLDHMITILQVQMETVELDDFLF